MTGLTLAVLKVIIDKTDPRLAVPRVILTYSPSSRPRGLGRQLERGKLVNVGGNHFVGFQDAKNEHGVLLRYLNLDSASHTHAACELCSDGAVEYEVLLVAQGDFLPGAHPEPLPLEFYVSRL